METTIRNKKGNPEKVRLNIKPYVLEFITSYFGSKNFSKSEFLTRRSNLSGFSRPAEVSVLCNLARTGWIKTTRKSSQKIKDSIGYSLSQKAKSYLDKFNSFLNENAPLMNSKTPQIKIVERRVPIKFSKEESFIGEV